MLVGGTRERDCFYLVRFPKVELRFLYMYVYIFFIVLFSLEGAAPRSRVCVMICAMARWDGWGSRERWYVLWRSIHWRTLIEIRLIAADRPRCLTSKDD